MGPESLSESNQQKITVRMSLPTKLASLLLFLSALGVMGEPDFIVEFVVKQLEQETENKTFRVKVHPDWAPLGAARFKELVEAKFYDDIRFFRVIPNFMVQFGLSGDPAKNAEWRAKPINDEPVKESNKPGYITFAKTGAPNSRTTQIFINYVDNARLDGMGFAPFGEVMDNGMETVKQIYKVGEKPNQGQIQSEGNTYLDKEFPQLSQVVSARVVTEDGKEL